MSLLVWPLRKGKPSSFSPEENYQCNTNLDQQLSRQVIWSRGNLPTTAHLTFHGEGRSFCSWGCNWSRAVSDWYLKAQLTLRSWFRPAWHPYLCHRNAQEQPHLLTIHNRHGQQQGKWGTTQPAPATQQPCHVLGVKACLKYSETASCSRRSAKI